MSSNVAALDDGFEQAISSMMDANNDPNVTRRLKLAAQYTQLIAGFEDLKTLEALAEALHDPHCRALLKSICELGEDERALVEERIRAMRSKPDIVWVD